MNLQYLAYCSPSRLTLLHGARTHTHVHVVRLSIVDHMVWVVWFFLVCFVVVAHVGRSVEIDHTLLALCFGCTPGLVSQFIANRNITRQSRSNIHADQSAAPQVYAIRQSTPNAHTGGHICAGHAYNVWKSAYIRDRWLAHTRTHTHTHDCVLMESITNETRNKRKERKQKKIIIGCVCERQTNHWTHVTYLLVRHTTLIMLLNREGAGKGGVSFYPKKGLQKDGDGTVLVILAHEWRIWTRRLYSEVGPIDSSVLCVLSVIDSSHRFIYLQSALASGGSSIFD